MKKLVMVLMLVGTPAWAGGSMASDVRIIRVSPSITSYGIVKEIQKRQEFEYKETYKMNGKMALEEQKFQQKRQLEEDRAYYKKLAEQRKARKK